MLGAAQTGGAFTDVPAADAFIKTHPEAFLIGVLFTQGVPAERAWAGPHLLARRLGHFDLARMVEEPGRVAEAVAEAPALHRFVKTLPGCGSSTRPGVCLPSTAATPRRYGRMALRSWRSWRGCGRSRASVPRRRSWRPRSSCVTSGFD